ncbi:MAG: SDR family NAD(P)-dependent oxidoreductase [Acholeplasmataceae bacterium]|jgi:3-oxoacyl-[acyl-carrier protein] reductase
MKRLEGKVAVITGGAKGLGRAMAETFAKEGAKVIAVDMAPLEYECKNVEFYELNITDEPGVEKFRDYAVEKYGHVDILVNNAGITRDAMLHKMSTDQWDLVINVNLKGVFLMGRAFGAHMRDIGGGSIINISSVVGEFGNIGQTNYAATKAGVIGMTKSWAKELARFDRKTERYIPVRVNAIAPGYTMTDMMKTVPQNLLDQFASQTMLGRLGQPQEIADAALFLASDESSYITGHVLSVNGGMRL